MKLPAFFSLVLLFVTGCFTETRSYTLTVRNNLATPISVCVTKTHSPPEAGWETPEELASPAHPPSDQTPPGMVIPPGKTLISPTLTGVFDRQLGQAILRVYLGTPTLSEMNAIGPTSINRLDIPLKIGPNRLQIKTLDGVRMSAASPDTATRPW